MVTNPDIMRENSTRDYYEKHATEYFNQTYAANLQPLWAKLSKHLHAQASILDLGCGSGRDVKHFADEGFNIVGVDYATSLLKLAKEFFQQPFVLGDFNFLPFRDNSFDAVWAIGSLLHTPRQSLPHVLNQIHRVLKVEGVLFSSIKKGHSESIDSCNRYNVFYLKDELQDILQESAYQVIQIEESIEIREIESGYNKKITWITCLAKTT